MNDNIYQINRVPSLNDSDSSSNTSIEEEKFLVGELPEARGFDRINYAHEMN